MRAKVLSYWHSHLMRAAYYSSKSTSYYEILLWSQSLMFQYHSTISYKVFSNVINSCSKISYFFTSKELKFLFYVFKLCRRHINSLLVVIQNLPRSHFTPHHETIHVSIVYVQTLSCIHLSPTLLPSTPLSINESKTKKRARAGG